MKHTLNILLLILTLVSFKNQSNSELNKSDRSTELKTLKFSQIIFGRYCGECDENCAPMFRLILDKKEPILSADFEDTYFSLENRMKFNTKLNQKEKFEIANKIAKNIPETLYNWKTDKERFGCPDCTDGCGYYLEFIKKNGNVKIFHLDDFEDTENIPEEVLEFTHYLANQINNLTE